MAYRGCCRLQVGGVVERSGSATIRPDFGDLTDELMKIFISQTPDVLDPHESVLKYYQSDRQISD